MDEMWMEKNMNMEMVRYKVLETGFRVGYIEFVDNSEVITSMHKWRGFWKGTFNPRTMYEYFKYEIYPQIFKEQLEKLKKDKKNNKKSFGVRNKKQFSIVEGVNDAQVQNNNDFDKDPDEELLMPAMKATDKKIK